MDLSLTEALNGFAARHDAFEDTLGAYVGASQVIFALVLVALFLAAFGGFRPLAQRAAVSAAVSAGVALLIAHFVSTGLDRARPFVAHPHAIHPFLQHAADPSFPSDHATAAFAIAVAVLLRRRAWGVVLLVLAVILSVGRVVVGVHYPSDVLAGAALGSAVALVLWWIPQRALLDRLADWLASLYLAALGTVRGVGLRAVRAGRRP